MRPTWIRGRWMEQFSFLMAEENQNTVQGPPLAQHKRQWAESTVPFLLQQETNSYQIFESPKFWKRCPNLYKWKKKRKKITCEIITKSKVPWRLLLFLGFSDKSNQRLVNSATRQDKMFVTFRVSRCSSDRASSVLGCFCCSDVSPAVIFKEHTFCNQGLFGPLAARANYNLNSPGKENLNLNQQLTVTYT